MKSQILTMAPKPRRTWAVPTRPPPHTLPSSRSLSGLHPQLFLVLRSLHILSSYGTLFPPKANSLSLKETSPLDTLPKPQEGEAALPRSQQLRFSCYAALKGSSHLCWLTPYFELHGGKTVAALLVSLICALSPAQCPEHSRSLMYCSVRVAFV